MNRSALFALAAAAASVLGVVSQASAGIVSVQFPQYDRDLYTTTGYNYNYSAGVSPYTVTNWNMALDIANRPANGAYTSTGSGLRDSTGLATGVGYSLTYRTADTTDANNFPAPPNFWVSTGQADIFLAGAVAFTASVHDFGNGTDAPGTMSLTVNGLDAGATYNLIAYVGKPWWDGAASASATVGGATKYFTTTNSLGVWQEATSTDSASPSVGNYVEFRNLTGSTSQILTINVPLGSAGLSGFQLISVPEPTSLGFLALGATAVLSRRRKA